MLFVIVVNKMIGIELVFIRCWYNDRLFFFGIMMLSIMRLMVVVFRVLWVVVVFFVVVVCRLFLIR